MTIRLKKISDTIARAYDVNPKFAEDMNHYIEQYAEYYYKIFVREWIKRKEKKNNDTT